MSTRTRNNIATVTTPTPAQITSATRGIVVSVPGAGFYIVAAHGGRHPLDSRPFRSSREARAALAAFGK